MNKEQGIKKEQQESKKVTKRGPLLIAILVLVLIAVLLTFFLTRETKDKILTSIEGIDDYEIVLEVNRNNEEIMLGKYQYDKNKQVMYFQLTDNNGVLEEQYYDIANKMLYVKNQDNGLYKSMDYETDYRLNTILNELLKKANNTSFMDETSYTIPYSDMEELLTKGDNLLTSYLISKNIQIESGNINLKVTKVGDDLDTIMIILPTKEHETEIILSFVKKETSLNVPQASNNQSNEALAAKWLIIYLQRIYANEPQEARGVTDINYFLNSEYGEELKNILTDIPTDVRLRVTPASNKEAGIVNGTLTFENGKVVTIENNQIKSVE